MIEIKKYWRSIFFIPWCKTLLTSRAVSYLLLICPAGPHQFASPDALKYIYEAFLFCVGCLLQCLGVRIRVQIFRPDLGSVRFPPLLYLVAHLPINTNILTSYVLVFIHQNILNSSLSRGKSSEANL